jgi:hypothetical protein
VLTWVLPGRAPASTEFSELTPAERGPQRL